MLRLRSKLHIDKCPTTRSMLHLLQRWLDSAEREALQLRHPSYVSALIRAERLMRHAQHRHDAIAFLHQSSNG